MSPIELAVEVAGWGGAALILLAYLLISTGKVTGKSRTYHWINLAGAVGFAINGWWYGAIPSAALNVVWAAIAIYALSRLIRRKGPAPASPE